MDISSIGFQHFNEVRNPFSSSPVHGTNSGEGFEEILRRMQSTSQVSDPGDRFRANDTPVSRNAPIDRSSQLFELCMELETMLIKNLIKGMRSTVQKTNLIDTGFAGEVYEDMLYDEYAKTFARNAGLGFAEMAYRDLSGIR